MRRRKRKNVDVGVWKRYKSYDLEIAPSLAGACHTFEFDGYNVRLDLPGRPSPKNWNKHDSRITCWGYRIRNGRKIPRSFSVSDVDLRLDCNISRFIQADAIGIVDVSKFSSRESKSLNRVVDKYDSILDDAYLHWLAVVRWASGLRKIGHQLAKADLSQWTARLFDKQTDGQFYAAPYRIEVTREIALTKRHWNKIQDLLDRQVEVPIWQTYLAEATHQYELGDYRRVLLDLAISCETVVRKLTTGLLARPENVTYKKIVDRVNISSILGKWSKLGFDDKLWLDLSGELKLVNRIFELRNAVIHRGEEPTITAHECYRLIMAASIFVKQSEKSLGIG
jgi:hypothetical protein